MSKPTTPPSAVKVMPQPESAEPAPAPKPKGVSVMPGPNNSMLAEMQGKTLRKAAPAQAPAEKAPPPEQSNELLAALERRKMSAGKSSAPAPQNGSSNRGSGGFKPPQLKAVASADSLPVSSKPPNKPAPVTLSKDTRGTSAPALPNTPIPPARPANIIKTMEMEDVVEQDANPEDLPPPIDELPPPPDYATNELPPYELPDPNLLPPPPSDVTSSEPTPDMTSAAKRASLKMNAAFTSSSPGLLQESKTRKLSTAEPSRKSIELTGGRNSITLPEANEKEIWQDKIYAFEQQHDAWTLLTAGTEESRKNASQQLLDILDVKKKGNSNVEKHLAELDRTQLVNLLGCLVATLSECS